MPDSRVLFSAPLDFDPAVQKEYKRLGTRFAAIIAREHVFPCNA